MGHNRETQSDSDDVPNTYKRNGVFYYRKRIPTDLVKAGIYGKKKEEKESLKTSDRNEARLGASRLDHLYEEKWAEARRRLNKEAEEEFVHRTKYRDLSKISDSERKSLVLLHFVELEKKTLKQKTRELEWSEDAVYTEEVLGNLELDFAVLGNDHPDYEQINWAIALEQFLNSHGVTVEDHDSLAFLSMEDLFKRATLENLRRSITKLRKGNSGKFTTVPPDSFFSKCGHETEISLGLELDALKSKTIEELCTKYLADKEKTGVTKGTLATYDMQFRILRDFFGNSTGIAGVNVERAQALVSFLAEIPPNASKNYTGKNLKEAVRLESNKASPQALEAKTQCDYLQGISAIFRHAVDLEWINSNPFAKKAVTSLLPEVTKKEVERFSPEELSRLLSIPGFLSLREDTEHYPRYWVTLLCLFHGLRANEACQLLVEDIKSKDGIHFLSIREEDDAGEKVKQLKTKQSRRRLPLNESFLKTGFLDFVEDQRAKGETSLFPTLKKTKRNSMADAVGKWFSRFRKQIIVGDSPKRGDKTLHSFRHSFRRAGRDLGISVPLMEALGGWSKISNKSSESDYGGGHSLEQLKETIDKLTPAGVDLDPICSRSDS